MDGIFMLFFLSLTMLLGSIFSGLIPLNLSLSEAKMRHVTIVGAGLLIGTALAVIIPEGIHTLYSNDNRVELSRQGGIGGVEVKADEHDHHHHHAQRRRREALSNADLDALLDGVDFFMDEMASSAALDNPTVSKRATLSAEDAQKLDTFLNQLSVSNQHLSRVLKRLVLDKDDFDKMQRFLSQLAPNLKLQSSDNQRTLRSLLSQTDLSKLETFLEKQLSPSLSLSDLAKKLIIDPEDVDKLNAFLSQLSPNMASKSSKRSRRDTEKGGALDVQKKAVVDAQALVAVPPPLPATKAQQQDTSESHSHSHGSSSAHSSIGVTLVLGFVFMLVIDQIGGKMTHKPHQTLDAQTIRNKITFTTTLGLIVHAAADGIALGAAAATSKTNVEIIVFMAIMLHKAPAAFGLVSFLMHEGLERARIRRHLLVFALAAPVMALFTFAVLKSNSYNLVSSDSTGLCMLFSAGTFLYVSTVHVLPEVQAHNEDRQFQTGEMMSFITGAILPLFLSIGHSH